jgi:murein DD-endopeptidase MepM/ murein hydrolase activator NlpD
MTSFESILYHYSKSPLYLLKAHTDYSAYDLLDLAAANTNLPSLNNADDYEVWINSMLEKHHKKVAYGGYKEIRAIYKRSSHFNTENRLDERNIHLGIDFWTTAGTAVVAPIPGKIHSFKNNTAFGDYGPTIILVHEIAATVFYTLYGHLSLASIANLNIGDTVNEGAIFAYLGDSSVNGDYAPHLHFQIIKDIGTNFGDFKGVTSIRDKEADFLNCPDPNLLLKIV